MSDHKGKDMSQSEAWDRLWEMLLLPDGAESQDEQPDEAEQQVIECA